MTLSHEQFINKLFSPADIISHIDLSRNKQFLKDNELLEAYQEKKGSEDYQKKLRQRNQLLTLIERNNKNSNFKTFYLKSFRSYEFIDHNLDLVILENEKKYTEALLKNGFQAYPNLADIREPWKKFYRHPSTEILLHLHRQVSWNGIIALDKKEVYARCRKITVHNHDIFVPCPEDHFLILAAHCLFENYYLTLGELFQLNNLLQQKLNFQQIDARAEAFHWKEGLNLFNSHLAKLLQSLNIEKNHLAATKSCLIKTPIKFPYYLKYSSLFSFYFTKMFKDIFVRPFNIPRQLFTYFFVGPIWQYSWKRIKKRFKK